MSQLSFDCLNEILEYLDDDMINLHSCLLINHLWCEISVRIIWRYIWNYETSNFRTLIACLPNESKEILYTNGIFISAPTSRSPMFNYAAFCKVFSVDIIDYNKIELLLNNKNIGEDHDLSNNTFIVMQEILKLYMKQSTFLKELRIYKSPCIASILLYPGAKDYLKNLSKLCCDSNTSSEFFYQLSQICQNIQSLTIFFEQVISNKLAELISAQKNLKVLNIYGYNGEEDLNIIIPSLTKHSNLSKLCLNVLGVSVSLSFITIFTNLQELDVTFIYIHDFVIQHAIFPQLQILKIHNVSPGCELLIKFLETNGKNLNQFYVSNCDDAGIDNSLNLAIAKFCPNLKKLSTGFENNELDTLKIVLNCCQCLESIRIWCENKLLSEKEALEAIVKYSHKNIYEIILYNEWYTQSELLPEELESFFESWTNRTPQKALSLMIFRQNIYSLYTRDKYVEIIEKYIKLGIVKKFEVR
ncbi:hypothetical protein C1645_812988 [Glomus cerebriforme]|uniref:F-box domain-containing protein n=1 Tax=Glomus cerebriforme TaxID=658196 RepID=A0A397TMX1_9GLOM|nr:hypothetical protein C1645_812988 [Glomus cerebriforme]